MTIENYRSELERAKVIEVQICALNTEQDLILEEVSGFINQCMVEDRPRSEILSMINELPYGFHRAELRTRFIEQYWASPWDARRD